MFCNIKWENQIDELTKEEWVFCLDDNLNCYIEGYTLMNKESTRRRKYKIVKQYTRIGDQRSMFTKQILKEEEVPITLEIEEKVKKIIIDSIIFKKWKSK